MHTFGRAAMLVAVIVASPIAEAAAQVMGPVNTAPPWTARQRAKPDGTEERYTPPATQNERPVMGAQPNEPPKQRTAPSR